MQEAVLPPKMHYVIVEMTKEGVTLPLIKKFAQSACEINVNYSDPVQIEAAVNVIEIVKDAAKNQEDRYVLFHDLDKYNPHLKQVHDDRYPRYKGLIY